jgi:AraC-like DNA-binding protein
MLSDGPFLSATVLNGLEAYLTQKGVVYRDVLRLAGLPEGKLDPAQVEVPLSTVVAIFDASARATQSACFGAEWSEVFDPGEMGAFGYLLRNAATVREALNVTVRYISLIIHPVAVEMEDEGSTTVLKWRFPPRVQSSSMQYLLFATAATVARFRTAAGGHWDPLHVELACAELPCKSLLRRILGPSISFASKETKIYIRTNTLDFGNSVADPHLFELLQNLADRMLRERCTQQGLPHVVKRIVSRRLGHGEITLETVAHEIGTPPRTLQNRLNSDGTSFDDLVQVTKQELAEDYLRDTDLPLNEIALMLGFSELSAFSRACHRWFDEPPSAHRRRLRQARHLD